MVMIHGDMWKVADIVEAVTRCRTDAWTAQTWRVDEVLFPKNWRGISYRDDQALAPEDMELVPDVWSHEHCEICMYRVDYRDEHRHAFTCDDRSWVCAECHEQFIRNDAAGVGR